MTVSELCGKFSVFTNSSIFTFFYKGVLFFSLQLFIVNSLFAQGELL